MVAVTRLYQIVRPFTWSRQVQNMVVNQPLPQKHSGMRWLGYTGLSRSKWSLLLIAPEWSSWTLESGEYSFVLSLSSSLYHRGQASRPNAFKNGSRPEAGIDRQSCIHCSCRVLLADAVHLTPISRSIMAKFHYADFPKTSPSGEVSGKSA